MKKLLLTLLLTVIIVGALKAGLGAPTIQAICKVTLKDGKTVEGFITFGPGGYEYNYKPHGFCFVRDNDIKKTVLYGFSFGKFLPDNNPAHRTGTTKLYYIENISKQRFPEKKTELDEKEKIITQTIIKKQKFKLRDHMVMYKKLPVSLHVGYGEINENEKVAIDVNEIVSVEILKNPEQKWLDIIDTARKRLIQKQNEEKWVDYAEPVWYHEVIKDTEKVNYLKQFF